jgi:hypothetical protein
MSAAIDGVACNVCNDGKLIPKVGSDTGKFAGQIYYVCSNWQYHKDGTGNPKSPWILASDAKKIETYLAGPEHVSKKRPAAAAPAAAAAKKPKSAEETTPPFHQMVTLVAKVAHLQERLEYLISIVEQQNSNQQQEPGQDEQATED